MQKIILQTIRTHEMIQEGDSIVVGLSGGADSVALLHVLLQLREELGIKEITAAHINHGLREAAAADEEFVQKLCDTCNIPLQIFYADVRTYAVENSLGIEEAGRKLRYLHLQEAACSSNAKIATGHHQNDNVETVIMNLARGAGLSGLCGIPPVNGNIIRPLIDLTREEIEKYIHAHGLKYITDASNLTDEYTRNRVRHSVLPALESATGIDTVQTIAKNIAQLCRDAEYLDTVAHEAFSDCVIKPMEAQCASFGTPHTTLDVKKLTALHPAISTRVIRRAMPHLTNITSINTNAILSLAVKKSGSVVHIPGIVARKEYSNIILTPASSTDNAPPHFAPISLSIPSVHNIKDQTISLTKTPPDKFLPPNPKKPKLLCTKSFDYGMVIGTISLRTRKPGDKIILHSTHTLVSSSTVNLSTPKTFTKKLQDYFTDKKTPKHKRDSILLLACGSDILWIMDENNLTSTKYSPQADNLFWVSIWSDT